MSLPANRLVNITINLTPTGVPPANFSTLLILGTTPVIDVSQRFRTYADLEEVGSDFSPGQGEYDASVLYFSQLPQPSEIIIGRWANILTAALFYGGTLSVAEQNQSNFGTITNGSFSIVVQGITYSITGVNLTPVAGLAGTAVMNEVAAIISTAVSSQSPAQRAVFNAFYQAIEIAGEFVTGSTIGFGAPPTATGNIAFTTIPATNTTMTFNGTVVTWKTSGATGNQVNIGVDTPTSLANLLTFLNGSTDSNIVQFDFAALPGGSTLFMSAVATGTAGNALTIATNVSGATVSGATLSGGSGTDLSGLLNLTSAEGAHIVPGIAAESALAAVEAIENLTSFYGLSIVSASGNDTQTLQVAPYIEGDSVPHIFGVTAAESAALLSSDSTSIGFQLKALGFNRTFVHFSTQSPYACVGVFGRMLTVDFTASNSTIIVMYGAEPGLLPEPLTSSQANALDANNYTYYGSYSNGASILVNGTMASGVFFDTIQGTDWLANAIQTAVFNLLEQQRVPQTDAGNNQIGTVIAGALNQGVVNGLLAPGTWNAAPFGQLKTGQFMPTGYYVFIPSIASQPENLRAKRISVPIQIAAKGAGAIQTANIAINFNP